ncbi:hypothetical protein IE81DRAFT_208496 [Ceraceosorus guamensis]|uniref:F-box domain-containing protein n=1 Tax=Ceraceosorus guamensis TaxID=1522189 RepID=A0A316W7X0_9BASI|nr:hypothetical protein IE81DRAFT_208496 [Ceraceosorus guamensis]PWN45218.1 hypothetical protein IE81DRAFT_208496 [Ceraceosorus guamensis]
MRGSTTATAMAFSLPELVLGILRHLPQRSDVLNAACVNQVFRDVAVGRMLRKTQLRARVTHKKLWRYLIANPEGAKLITRLDITRGWPDVHSDGQEWEARLDPAVAEVVPLGFERPADEGTFRWPNSIPSASERADHSENVPEQEAALDAQVQDVSEGEHLLVSALGNLTSLETFVWDSAPPCQPSGPESRADVWGALRASCPNLRRLYVNDYSGGSPYQPKPARQSAFEEETARLKRRHPPIWGPQFKCRFCSSLTTCQA